MTQAVANRYVTALADVVSEPGCELAPEAALEQLQSFADLMAESPELESVLLSPAIQPAAKHDLLAEIAAQAGWSRLIRNFLAVLTDHRRLGRFDLIVQGFCSWLDAHRGRVEVRVRVATALDDKQRATLENRFRELTGKQVRATYEIAPELLGGCLAMIGSTLYDGSLRSTLGTLSAGLAGRGR